MEEIKKNMAKFLLIITSVGGLVVIISVWLIMLRQGITVEVMSSVIGAMVVLGGVMNFVLYILINQQLICLEDMKNAADKISDGNLAVTINKEGLLTVHELQESFVKMRDSYTLTVSELMGLVSQITIAAGQLSSTTAETSREVGQQNAEIDQVVASMEQMVATVHEVARNTAVASDAAKKAHFEASGGGRVVKKTIALIEDQAEEIGNAADVIEELERETENIGTILDVIRDIAEQTNLLALNAAIEAARAGDAGRGFVVVADEVRSLAQRTQDSTEKIQTMIENLQLEAQNAVRLMSHSRAGAVESVDQIAQVGKSFTGITDPVNKITDMNTQIASAAEEQNAVAEEIKRNVVNISRAAETTTRGAQLTASHSEEFANLATRLSGLLSKFTL